MELIAPETEQNKKETGKRPYTTPQVFNYGDIREITKNIGPKGADDFGGGAAAGPKTGV